MIDRYAVIGNPVAHSVSPQIHDAFAAATGEALRYEKIRADAFAPAATAFFQAGGLGLNVTVPFKQDAFDWVDRVDGAAREAQAVNVVVRGNDRYRGHNTDGIGLVRDLEKNLGLPLANRRVLVLGAGGAVRGVLGPLLRTGVEELTVANRTESRAYALQSVFPDIRAVSFGDVGEGCDIVINGTSAGMAGEVPDVDPRTVRNAFCYDMFYTLEDETPFCRWCAECGAARAAGGLGMLIEQAAESFFLWRRVRPPTRGLAQSLRA